ncbi:MAG: radical SAM protein [Candidatus Sigynarchaeota archaeon]
MLLVDGYVDEPGCLGVPPYLSPYARYIYGALKRAGMFQAIKYLTVDQFRKEIKQSPIETKERREHARKRWKNEILADPRWRLYDVVVMLSGVSVPGKYLGGKPVRFSELVAFAKLFPRAVKILCGPATRFGIGEEGGKPSIPADKLEGVYDAIIRGDAEIVLPGLLQAIDGGIPIDDERIRGMLNDGRSSMDQITDIAIAGAELVIQHPNFRRETGGNLVCELETFRGCPRYESGGCSFCVEPSKGPTMHRPVEAIVREAKALHDLGVRHFRLGNQTDFYAYQHQGYDNPRYPRPNPRAIKELLESIRYACPGLKTLHIDNVNALNFALYPEEARAITRLIVEHCTPGNIAALGVESVDPVVIEKNNLKASREESMAAVRTINEIGAKRGENGNPCFLPGVNFIAGLPGETAQTLELNLDFLKEIVDSGLMLRRVNIRKLLVTTASKKGCSVSESAADLDRDGKFFASWKDLVRETVDRPMLRRVFPPGTVLTGAYAEQHEGHGTYCRQPGTYPILCYVPRNLALYQEYALVVVDYGYRSLTCLTSPVDVSRLTLKELEAIPGIGEKRARKIFVTRPKTKAAWLDIVTQEIWELLVMLDPCLEKAK